MIEKQNVSKSLEGLKLAVTLEKTATRIREHNDDVSDAVGPGSMLSNWFQPAWSTYAVVQLFIWILSACRLFCLFLIGLTIRSPCMRRSCFKNW